jgi:putative transposase
VIQRGVDRSDCFSTPMDHAVYLRYLEELAGHFDCDVHAYVLMTNHVHLLATPHGPESMSFLMRNLGQRYVQYFNKAHRRTGGLWEGRYRSSFVATDEYLLACYRYIELNPVRAGMVSHPAAYSWSSYRTNADGDESSLVTPHALYLAMGSSDEARRGAYKGLFRTALEDWRIKEFRKRTNAGHAIGSDAFIAALENQTGARLTARQRGRRSSVPNSVE